MTEKIKNFFRAVAARPTIGRPVRGIVSIIKSPQTRRKVFNIGHRVNKMNNRINEIDQRISGINHRLSDMSDHINDVDQQISGINSRFSEMNNHINDIERQISDIGLLIGGMSRNIDEIRQQQVRESEHLPRLLESLNYYENLKRSLPVAFRKQVRKSCGSDS